MKIFKKLAAAFLTAAVLSAHFTAPVLEVAAEAKPVYLALGDSITTGYRLSGGHFKEEGYVNILAQKNGYQLHNCAVDGNTAGEILKQLKSKSLQNWVKKAKLITITCGGNDMVNALLDEAVAAYNTLNSEKPLKRSELLKIYKNQKDERYKPLLLATGFILSDFQKSDRFKETLSEFKSALSDIIKTLKELNPDSVIFVATQYNPYAHFSGEYKTLLSEPAAECIKLLNQCIKSGAGEGNYTAVDVYTAFLNNESLLLNASENPIQLDFHPSREGHEIIAACFQKAIDSASFPDDKLEKASADFQKSSEENKAVYRGLIAGAAIAVAVIFLRAIKAAKAANRG